MWISVLVTAVGRFMVFLVVECAIQGHLVKPNLIFGNAPPISIRKLYQALVSRAVLSGFSHQLLLISFSVICFIMVLSNFAHNL